MKKFQCTQEDIELFSNPDTKLEDIEKAGWNIHFSGSGYWCFEKINEEKMLLVYYAPFWIHELASKAHDRAVEFTRMKIQEALGIKKATHAAPCAPGFKYHI